MDSTQLFISIAVPVITLVAGWIFGGRQKAKSETKTAEVNIEGAEIENTDKEQILWKKNADLLSKQNEELLSKVIEIQGQNVALLSEVAELRSENAELKKDVQALKEDYDMLLKKYETQ